jgi:prefoldin subunit 5
MTREQELDLLKGQAEAIKRELDQVEARIRDLESNKKE